MSSLGCARATDAEGRFRLAIPHGTAAELIVYPERRAPLPRGAPPYTEQMVARRVSVAAGGGDLGDIRLEAGWESTEHTPTSALGHASEERGRYLRVPRGSKPIGHPFAGECQAIGSKGSGYACLQDRIWYHEG
jgi:hypothetical protein